MHRGLFIIFTLLCFSSFGQTPGTFTVRKDSNTIRVKQRSETVDLLWLGGGVSGGSPATIIDNVHARLTFRSKRAVYFGPEAEYYYTGLFENKFSIGLFGQKRYLVAPLTVVVVEANYHIGLGQMQLEYGDPGIYQNLGIGIGFDWWFLREWRLQLMLEYQVNAVGRNFEERLTPVARINWPLFFK